MFCFVCVVISQIASFQETGQRSFLHDVSSKILQPENNNEVNGKLKFAPASWDWRQQGAVTPVQNQGMLGDAQAIVAAGELLIRIFS